MVPSRLIGSTFLAAVLLVTGCTNSNAYLRQRASESMEIGRLAAADGYLERAVSNDPADARAQRMLGMLRLRQDRPLDAQLHLERALAIRPAPDERPKVIDALAEAFYRQGEHDKLYKLLAREAKREADAYGWLRQATYLARLGDVDGAAVAYRKAVRLAPEGDVEPWLAMASFLEAVGDTAGAIETLRYAYGVDPDDERVAERLRDHGVVPGPTIALPEK